MKLSQTIVGLMLISGLSVSPLFAGDATEADDSDLRMDQVLAQAETTPEAEQQRQAGPARDPLDPQPARMRAMQVGGGDQEVTSGTAFNPAISVILDGVYYNEFSGHVEDAPGFDFGHDHGHGGHGHGLESGFQIREAELSFSGTVDPYFDMFVMAALFENGVELEEAYVTTRSLPAGLQIKAGRFLSDVGYINKQHIHDWQFVDAPWVIDNLFGEEGLRENGIQLTWMPATRSYTRFGLELLHGESEGVANYVGDGRHEMVTVLPRHVVDPNVGPDDPGAEEPVRNRWRDDKGLHQTSSPRLITAFAKWAPNLGYDHALQLGVFGGVSDAHQMEETHSSGRLETWDGDAKFYGFDLVYKYDGGGIHGHRSFQFQTEYIRREMNLHYQSRQFTDFGTLEPTTRNPDGDVVDQEWVQDGIYAQAVYGFAPRWNMGLRVDALGLTNDAYEDQPDGRGLPVSLGSSKRFALQTTYAPTEFSRIRAQLNYNDFAHHDDEAWEFMLQYNISLGVHGAHAF
ncbi:zinc-regulated TonB-dependent outer membrane receptor [Gammaproteobacteria bacterium AB-CW1]|uniref:Zinc-regulated TonB-dependent outer membrane receptor n=1 Tax=Natronospira elongata TaxID=3110268 RepID=A0AAP6JEV3_9GAMM|nr:zinc-regulated TonB-dependent outer membrane receptor [Gammaproteobacteria bacterium AB-CW1]